MDCSLACLFAVVAIREQSFLRAVVVSMPCAMKGAVRLCHAISTGVRDASPAQLPRGGIEHHCLQSREKYKGTDLSIVRTDVLALDLT